VSASGVGRLGRWHVGGSVHRSDGRGGALTRSALGVPAGDEAREGEGVCCLFVEDIIRAGSKRSINPNLHTSLIRARRAVPSFAPFSTATVHSPTGNEHTRTLCSLFLLRVCTF